MTTTPQFFSDIKPIDLTPLITFQLYASIKLHFSNKKYDFNKYGVNLKSFNENTYANRPDIFYFNKLSQKILYQDRLKYILISNLYLNNKIWVGELLSNQSITNAMVYRKYINSLQNSLSTEVNKLIFDNEISDVSELYSQNTKTNYFSMQAQGKISPMTASILNQVFYTKYLGASPLSFVYAEKSFYLQRYYDLLPKEKVSSINEQSIYDMIF